MGFFSRIKAWFVKPTPDLPLTVQFAPDPRGAPGYRLAIIRGSDMEIQRRVRILHPEVATCLEAEIWAHRNPDASQPPPALEDEAPVPAFKRAAIIESIRVEIANAQ